MAEPLNYTKPSRKQEPLWWRITEIGIYVSGGLLTLMAIMFILRLVWRHLF